MHKRPGYHSTRPQLPLNDRNVPEEDIPFKEECVLETDELLEINIKTEWCVQSGSPTYAMDCIKRIWRVEDERPIRAAVDQQ
jgi:hypothetical protein